MEFHFPSENLAGLFGSTVPATDIATHVFEAGLREYCALSGPFSKVQPFALSREWRKKFAKAREEIISIWCQAGIKQSMQAWSSFCWRLLTKNLLTYADIFCWPRTHLMTFSDKKQACCLLTKMLLGFSNGTIRIVTRHSMQTKNCNNKEENNSILLNLWRQGCAYVISWVITVIAVDIYLCILVVSINVNCKYIHKHKNLVTFADRYQAIFSCLLTRNKSADVCWQNPIGWHFLSKIESADISWTLLAWRMLHHRL